MFRRKDKPRSPANYRSLMNGGTGLWEIWFDRGPGTKAAPVYYPDAPGGTGLTCIHGAHTFLFDSEASAAAKELARQHPDKRFAVKLKEW